MIRTAEATEVKQVDQFDTIHNYNYNTYWYVTPGKFIKHCLLMSPDVTVISGYLEKSSSERLAVQMHIGLKTPFIQATEF